MITCHIKYIIDPHKLDAFAAYARSWIPIVNRMGGQHHGYLLPHEGANNIAYALFSFPSLSAYEAYRAQANTDAQCITLYEAEKQNRSIISYERSFLRPLLQ